jgi:hypothetical protein
VIIKMLSLSCLLFFAFGGSIFGQTSPEASAALTSTSPTRIAAAPSGRPKTPPPPLLGEVMKEVQKAVDKYQESLGGGASALPPLQSAEFDFKVVTEKTLKGSISFFIFSIGGSTGKSTVNDVAYTYEVPKPAGKAISEEPPVLTETLARTIQEAARAVKESGTLGDLRFTKLVVEIQFGVKWIVGAGGTASYQFVTLNLGAEKSKNTVQSVKLTFKEPEKSTKP